MITKERFEQIFMLVFDEECIVEMYFNEKIGYGAMGLDLEQPSIYKSQLNLLDEYLGEYDALVTEIEWRKGNIWIYVDLD